MRRFGLWLGVAGVSFLTGVVLHVAAQNLNSPGLAEIVNYAYAGPHSHRSAS